MDFYKVILVNGFSKNNRKFNFLKNHLTSLGFNAELLETPLFFNDVSFTENALEKKLNEIIKVNEAENTASELVLIGFGLGGAIIKKVLHDKKINNLFIKVILIATPCRRSRISRKLSPIIRLLSKVFKPLKLLRNNKYLSLPLSKDISIGIIRGVEPGYKIFQKLINEPNDGIFQTNEVTLKGENIEILDIPFGRVELLRRRGTAEYIVDFIETGRFKFD
ncbi:MAG: hypothetical protein ACRC7W_04900 [Fusobacteriaceae bacterium]